jgi:hypothetical protein
MLKGLNIKLHPIKGCRTRIDQWPRQRRILNTATYTKVSTPVRLLCHDKENCWEKRTSVFSHSFDESENNSSKRYII